MFKVGGRSIVRYPCVTYESPRPVDSLVVVHKAIYQAIPTDLFPNTFNTKAQYFLHAPMALPPPPPPPPPIASVLKLSDLPVEVKHLILRNLPDFYSLNALSCTCWAFLCATREYRASLLFSAYMMEMGFGELVMNSEIDSRCAANPFECGWE